MRHDRDEFDDIDEADEEAKRLREEGQLESEVESHSVAEILINGGVGVIPTDTLYGLVGSALIPETIDRIYDLKHRDPKKPLIVLISELGQLEQFGIELSEGLLTQLGAYWPGPYTIILPTLDDQFEYLSRGTDTIAFRLPNNSELCALISEAGPLVAPSANAEGMPPATTVEQAQKYFGTDVEFYIDGGELDNKASTILRLDCDAVEVIRD